MSDLVAELEALRRQNEELRRRLDDRQRVDTLRRALRGCETLDDVAMRGVNFAHADLDASPCALWLEDRARGGFVLQATAGLEAARGSDAPFIARTEALADALPVGGLIVHTHESPVDAVAAPAAWMGRERLLVAGLYDETELIGVLVAATGHDVDAIQERWGDVVAELSSATGAALRTRSRIEELAVLEVQERELVSLLRDVEQRDASTRADLEQARTFQQLMMEVPAVRGAKVEAFYEPLELVGGDVYVVSPLADRIRIFIADATGHGVRASLTTMFIKSGYESLKHAPDPGALLASLNESIAFTYRSSEMLFSATCVDVFPESGEVTVANAGHPPACIVRSGEATLIEAEGALMGVRAGMKYPNVRSTLRPGDGLYLVTDGIADVRAEDGTFFGEDRLYALISDHHARNASVTCAVRDAISAFAGTRERTDDMALVGLRLD